jgi:DnaJ-class molecular chaperone
MKNETESLQQDTVLEEECPVCAGTGSLCGPRCSACHGTSRVPTELGESILALVRRHLNVSEDVGASR